MADREAATNNSGNKAGKYAPAWGYLLAAAVLFCAVALVSYSPTDSPDRLVSPRPSGVHNLCGKLGAYVAGGLLNAVGVTVPLLLAAVAFVAWSLIRRRTITHLLLRVVGVLLLLLGTSGLTTMGMSWSPGPVIGPGGYLGGIVRFLLLQHLAPVGAVWLLLCCVVSGLVLAADDLLLASARIANRARLYIQTEIKRRYATKSVLKPVLQPTVKPAAHIEEKVPEKKLQESLKEIAQKVAVIPAVPVIPVFVAPEIAEEIEEDIADADEDIEAEPEEDEDYEDEDYEDEDYEDEDCEDEHEEEIVVEEEDDSNNAVIPEPVLPPAAPLPTMECLTVSPPFDRSAQEEAVLLQAEKLQQAFADFGFKIDVVEFQIGPVIGQFEIQLEKGLRLSKIMGLTDDLAVALKVPSVRIVAPMPGKNTVGVEIPNVQRQMVRLRDVMEHPDTQLHKMAIPIFLGQDVTGAPLTVDLAKLPHLLIAGRTGTGKSVCLNSIIVSILMTRRSDEVKMLMIDPKMVELSPYKTIPHLIHPVVIDMRKAEAILGWAVDKMEERYQFLARAGVRHLAEYNKLSRTELRRRMQPEFESDWQAIPKSMPYLVIIADEMADLMMTAGKEVESHIIRLAQKSRAVGIHLVLATQKPTVDIITGLIKSNLPARIAFQVASRTDSQVVLDRNGAEKLLGNGDMLFLQPGTSLVQRGQGTYVSDTEIEQVIAEVSSAPQEFAAELVALEVGDQSDAGATLKDPRDPVYQQAVECVIGEGKGSVSLLQRKLEIGYGRAARIIDFMEADGIVGPSQGATPREVLKTISQWRQQLHAPPPPKPQQPISPISHSAIVPTLVPPPMPATEEPEEEAEEMIDERTDAFVPSDVFVEEGEGGEEDDDAEDEWHERDDDEPYSPHQQNQRRQDRHRSKRRRGRHR